jgi:prophage antirepressor-like protein
MNSLATFSHDFEGEPIVTLTYGGRPAWVARHIGARLGYSHGGKRLPGKILGDWKDDFIEGQDYTLLAGAELAALREAGADQAGGVSHKARREVLLLFESGLWMTLVRTRQPIGRRLRRFLVEQVLPQIARTGRYLPGDAARQATLPFVPAEETRSLVPAPPSEVQLIKRERERRLAARQELDCRKFESGVLRQTVRALHEAEQIDQVTRLAYEVVAAEIALGRELPELRPVVQDKWQSPTQIAQAAGVSVQAVGRLISKLELRGAEGLSRQVINKARGSDRTVFTYVYNDRAAAQIQAALGAPKGAE